MASFDLLGPPSFPEGTSVAAYPVSNWNGAQISGAPVGSSTESKTVTSGVAAFASLAADTRYVAYAQVGSDHRYVRFSTLTDPTSVSAASASATFDTWVDLCAAPYNLVPGDDATTALQTACNEAATAEQNRTIIFSKAGRYTINGAQQSGTAFTYAYSGQVIFPAVPFTDPSISIRIMGSDPAPTGFASSTLVTGVVLESNATSGNVFDAIAAANSPTPGAYYPSTNVKVTFEDITVRLPSNPQCGGINGSALTGLRFVGSVCVDAAPAGAWAINMNVLPTGTLPMVTFPPHNNEAVNHQIGDMMVAFGPIGIKHSEHEVFDNLFVQQCAVAIESYGAAGHMTVFNRLLVQGCPTVFKASAASGAIDCNLDVGDIAGSGPNFGLQKVVDDSSSQLWGRLRVYGWAANEPRGVPLNGAKNLVIEPASTELGHWPHDTFKRVGYGTGVQYMGCTDRTGHKYETAPSGAGDGLVISAGTVKASTNSSMSALAKYQSGRPSPSRIARYSVTLSGAYNWFALLGVVISGSKAGNWLSVSATGGVVSIGKRVTTTNSTLASSAAAAIAVGSHTIEVVITKPLSGAQVVDVYLNGSYATPVVTYTLNSTDIADLLDTDKSNTRDGFGFFSDQNSSCTEFQVLRV